MKLSYRRRMQLCRIGEVTQLVFVVLLTLVALMLAFAGAMLGLDWLVRTVGPIVASVIVMGILGLGALIGYLIRRVFDPLDG